MNARTKRRLFGVIGGLTGVVGVLGVIHAGPVRHMMHGECPLGHAPPAAVQAATRDVVRTQRGAKEAAARPALGFTLDTSKIQDVRDWAKKVGVSCVEKREGTLMMCSNVPATALDESQNDAIDEVAFGFKVEDGTLTNMTTLRLGMTADHAARAMASVTSGLSLKLGDPSSHAGSATADDLASGPGATATISYKYSDYLADVTTTSIEGRGLVMREHYMSARM